MADNSQVADALRTIAEAADDSTTADKIMETANTIAVPEAFLYAPNASDYGYPDEHAVYIDHDHHEALSRGPIIPADKVNERPTKWAWQHHEEDEDYRRKYTYEAIAEAWEQAHE
jgi:hypothetical protein